MAPDQSQLDAVGDVLAWLEDGLRETKSQVFRLEQGVEEASGRILELTGKVHAAEDAAAAVGRRFGELTPLPAQVAQVRQSTSQVEERVHDAERRLDEALRLQQQESERQRLELNGALRRIELLERVVEGWGSRFETLEAMIGRIQEALTLVRQRTEETDRRQEASELHAVRGVEALKRYEHRIGHLELEIESLQKGDSQALERIQVFGEGVKRFEGRLDAIAAEITSQRDIFERIDLLRAELHRLEDRISAGETEQDLDRKEIEDHQRLIGLLDGKNHGFADRLTMLQGELSAYRDLVSEQFNRLHLTLDRQKRHQIEELHRELRDLQVNAFRPPEELAVEGKSER